MPIFGTAASIEARRFPGSFPRAIMLALDILDKAVTLLDRADTLCRVLTFLLPFVVVGAVTGVEFVVGVWVYQNIRLQPAALSGDLKETFPVTDSAVTTDGDRSTTETVSALAVLENS
ncbi:hypothetical protein OF83DRAFT_1170228 [Amylostereum chailletii]|nr:hypothetical protein OF83DRAFT_1170228 [Amylostereum chailletii]